MDAKTEQVEYLVNHVFRTYIPLTLEIVFSHIPNDFSAYLHLRLPMARALESLLPKARSPRFCDGKFNSKPRASANTIPVHTFPEGGHEPNQTEDFRGDLSLCYKGKLFPCCFDRGLYHGQE